MIIKELEDKFTQKSYYESEIANLNEDIKEKIERLEKLPKDKKDPLLRELEDAKDKLNNLNHQLNLIKEYSIPINGEITFNRNMIGNQVADLISDIKNKKYVYQEDYVYKIDWNANPVHSQYNHANILKEKIHSVVDEKYKEHDPFIEYYDKQEIDFGYNNFFKNNRDGRHNYWKQKKYGYVNEFEELIKNEDLFLLPSYNDFIFNDEDKMNEYNQGLITYNYTTCDCYYHNARINPYSESRLDSGYNEHINEFLLTVIVKGLYLGKSLTEEEITKVRVKYIDLLKSGYDFSFYNDDLFNLDDEKTLKKK